MSTDGTLLSDNSPAATGGAAGDAEDDGGETPFEKRTLKAELVQGDVDAVLLNWCINAHNSTWLDVVVVACIVINTLILTVQHPCNLYSDTWLEIFRVTDVAITIFFSVEMFIHIKAMGLWNRDYDPNYWKSAGMSNRPTVKPSNMPKPPPYKYLNDGWNQLDFVVVLASWLTALTEVSGVSLGIELSTLRALRVLRLLRSMRFFGGIKTILRVVGLAVPTSMNVLAFMSFLAIVSGIIGIQMFRGHTLSRCEYGAVDLQGELQPDKFPLVDSSGVSNFNVPLPPEAWLTVLNNSHPSRKPAIGADFVAMKWTDEALCLSTDLLEREQCEVGRRRSIPEPHENAGPSPWEYPLGIGMWWSYCTVDADCPMYDKPDAWNRTQVCVPAANPGRGFHNFDTIMDAWIALFINLACLYWWETAHRIADAADGMGSDIAWGYGAMNVIMFTYISINMFIAVITTIFEDVRAEEKHDSAALSAEAIAKQQAEAAAAAERASWAPPWYYVAAFGGPGGPYKLTRPEKADGAKREPQYYGLINHTFFDQFVLILILVNTVLLSLEYHHADECTRFAPHKMCQTVTFRELAAGLNVFFNFAFALECILKILGMGFRAYIKVVFNKLDFFIVMTSIVDMIGQLVATEEERSGGGVFLLFRVLRLARVLRVTRFLYRNKNLQRVMKTVFGSGAALANLGAFVMFSIMLFGVIGMHLFGGNWHPNNERLLGFGSCETDPESGDPLACVADNSGTLWGRAVGDAPISVHGTGHTAFYRYDVEEMVFKGIIPRRNFEDFPRAFLLSFQIMTGDDWVNQLHDYLYVFNGWAPALYFFFCFGFCNFILLSLFVAVILENFAVAEEEKLKLQKEVMLTKAEEWEVERKRPKICLAHRIQFVFGGQGATKHHSPFSFDPEKLNIHPLNGKILAADDPSGPLLRRALKAGVPKEELRAPLYDYPETRTPEQLKVLFDEIDTDGGGTLDKREIVNLALKMGATLTQEELDEAMKQMDEDGSGDVDFEEFMKWWLTERQTSTSEWAASLREASKITVVPVSDTDWTPSREVITKKAVAAGVLLGEMDSMTDGGVGSVNCLTDDKSLFLFGPDNNLRQSMQAMSTNPWWNDVTITGAIIFGTVMLALEGPAGAIDPEMVHVFDLLATILYFIFLAEFLIKVIALGFFFTPNAYLKNSWNQLDFTVILGSTVTILGGDAGPIRLLRCLRPLRILRKIEGMRLIIVAIESSFSVNLGVMALAGLGMLVFAILGVALFGGQFFSCNCSHAWPAGVTPMTHIFDIDGRAWPANSTTLGSWNESTSSVPVATLTQVLDKRQCMGYPDDSNNYPGGIFGVDPAFQNTVSECYWDNRPYNFDSVGVGMTSLFTASTLAGWTDIMEIAMDIRGIDMQPLPFANYYAAVYFVLFVVLMSFFTANIFIGVLIDFISQQDGSALLTEEQQKLLDLEEFQKRNRPTKADLAPEHPLRLWFFGIITSELWDQVCNGVILFNVAVMLCEYQGMSSAWFETLEFLNDVCLYFFTVDMAFKLIALFPMAYAREGWNRFDAFVVIVSWVAKLLEAGSLQAVRAMRCFRIVLVIKSAKGLRSIFNVLKHSIYPAMNIGQLLALLFALYGILGMQLFGNAPLQDVECLAPRDGSQPEYCNVGTPTGWTHGQAPAEKVEEFNQFRSHFANISKGGPGHMLMGMNRQYTHHTSFRTFGGAFRLLWQCMSGQDWKFVMYAVGGEPGMGEGYLWVIAFLYFYSFYFLANYILLNMFIAVIIDKFAQSMREDSLEIHEDDFKEFKVLFRSMTTDELPDDLAFTDIWNLLAEASLKRSHDDGENPFSPPERDQWSEEEQVAWKRSLPGSSSAADISFHEVKDLVERLYSEADSPLNRDGQPGYVLDRDEEDDEGERMRNGQFDEYWVAVVMTPGLFKGGPTSELIAIQSDTEAFRQWDKYRSFARAQEASVRSTPNAAAAAAAAQSQWEGDGGEASARLQVATLYEALLTLRFRLNFHNLMSELSFQNQKFINDTSTIKYDDLLRAMIQVVVGTEALTLEDQIRREQQLNGTDAVDIESLIEEKEQQHELKLAKRTNSVATMLPKENSPKPNKDVGTRIVNPMSQGMLSDSDEEEKGGVVSNAAGELPSE